MTAFKSNRRKSTFPGLCHGRAAGARAGKVPGARGLAVVVELTKFRQDNKSGAPWGMESFPAMRELFEVGITAVCRLRFHGGGASPIVMFGVGQEQHDRELFNDKACLALEPLTYKVSHLFWIFFKEVRVFFYWICYRALSFRI